MSGDTFAGSSRTRHGTPSGWSKHMKDGERPCDPCYRAKAEYDHGRRAIPEQTLRSRQAAKAQQMALRRLKDMHPAIYAALYAEAKAAVMGGKS
jgi:hypothetical protein